MEYTQEGMEIDYKRVDEVMEKMKNSIDTFTNQHTDIFKEDITNLFEMNSDFVEQQRKIPEALTYRVGTTIISDMNIIRNYTINTLKYKKQTNPTTKKTSKIKCLN